MKTLAYVVFFLYLSFREGTAVLRIRHLGRNGRYRSTKSAGDQGLCSPHLSIAFWGLHTKKLQMNLHIPKILRTFAGDIGSLIQWIIETNK